ncbi:MAG: hypothetical protein HY898_02310 [Deltaproteobacteria bacterium]|nr:hypothetical protein [Deltaproteobacteria bacterium]
MRAFTPSLALIGAVVLPIACGGTPPPPPRTAPPVAPTATTPVIATAPPIADMTPAAEPQDTFAIVRWRSPSRTFTAIREMFGQAVPVDDLVHEVLSANAALLAQEAPVDAVFTLDPKGVLDSPPWVGLSIGVRSLDEAKQAFDKKRPVVEVRPGIYKVDAGSHSGMSCLLGPSVGAAPARIVCSDREEQATALLPYMTRSLPTVAMPDTDLHGELRMAPIQARYGKQLPIYLAGLSSFASHYVGTGDRKLDAAISDAMNGVSTDAVSLVNDLDGLVINANLAPASKSADADVTLKLKGRSSWFAQRLFEKAGEAGPAPAIFWRAPADADMAVYGRGMDPKGYAGFRQSGGDLLVGLLSTVDFPAGERKAVRNLWDQLFVSAPVMVSSQGHVDAPPAAGGDKIEEIRAMVISTMGWQLYGFEESSKRASDWLNDLAALYNRPAVKDWIVKKTGVDRKLLPSAKVTPFGKGLDRGTKALEIAVTIPPEFAAMGRPGAKGAAPAKPAAPISYWIVVMPDGPRTWVAASADKAALEKHLAMVKSGSPDSGTIASKAGLDIFKNGRTVSGGYLSLASLASSASGGLGALFEGRRRSSRSTERLKAALAKIPNRGETPIILEATAQSGGVSEYAVKLHMTKGTTDDIAAFVNAVSVAHRRPAP